MVKVFKTDTFGVTGCLVNRKANRIPFRRVKEKNVPSGLPVTGENALWIVAMVSKRDKFIAVMTTSLNITLPKCPNPLEIASFLIALGG